MNTKNKKYLKELMPYFIIIIVVIIIRSFIVTPVIVSGPSMQPTLKNNQVIILNKLAKIDRYNIVVTKYQNEKLIKRVIGLPGETIECINGKIFINNEEIEDKTSIETEDFVKVKLKSNEYFLLGDNRIDSIDSRIIGPVKEEKIEGTTSFTIWPISKFGTIE